MRIIVAAFAGLVALAAVSAQATPSPNQENWRPLSRPLSFALGDQAAATAGIKPSGGIGGAIGGGVRACPIDELVALGGRLNGLGA